MSVAVTEEKLSNVPQVSSLGYQILEGKSRWAITPKAFMLDDRNDLGRKREDRIGYLEGLRGLLAFQVMLWSFFRLLAPAMVVDMDVDLTYPAPWLAISPSWMNGIRKGLSPLFFDGSLQSTFFMILSARVVVNTFLERRTATSLAGSAFRRPLRFIPSIALTLALVSIITASGGFKFANQMSIDTENKFAQPPLIWENTIQYFNSIVGLFFSIRDNLTDRMVTFVPPTGILWFLPRVFQQSFTVITFSYLLPFTIFKYKFIFFGIFILVTFWIGSWAWYSLTGLLLAELVVVYFPMIQDGNLPIGKRFKVKVWILPAVFFLIGTTLKYLWASIPERRFDELNFHTTDGGGLNRNFDVTTTAFPRIDDYLVATGALFLLELSPLAQKAFDNPVLRFLGRISFPLYLISGTIFLSLGSFIRNHLVHNQEWKDESQILAVLIFSCVPVALVSAEIFQRVVEEPSLVFARWMFKFMKEE